MVRELGIAPRPARTVGDAEALLRGGDIGFLLLESKLAGVTALPLVIEGRERGVPAVVLLDAGEEPAARAIALELGAAGCLQRPYDPRELRIMLRRLLRPDLEANRVRSAGGRVFRFGAWTLDPEAGVLGGEGTEDRKLTSKELDLLVALLTNVGRVVNRDQLAQAIGHRSWLSRDRTIDVLVSQIRHKLGAMGGRMGPIRSVRGRGYVLVETVTLEPRRAPEGGGTD